MTNNLYEIMLDNITLKIGYEIWKNIQFHVRENKWFYVIYKGSKYKYDHDITFMERSTIFCFNKLKDDSIDEIDLIEIE